ncbi:ABC transporter ATP-binding protein [Thermoleophilia bacterium SCSIO 60948]|nr:ABC transporter ATP-binding protein [Thermoleophilia bacterium SCSIO 60948]
MSDAHRDPAGDGGVAASRPRRLARLAEWVRRLIHSDTARDGVVLAAPELPLRTVFGRFWPMTRGFRGAIALATLLVVCLPLLAVAEIWLFKVAVDEVLVPADLSALAWVAAAFLGLTLIGCLASFAEGYLSDWVAERFLLDLRGRVFAHLETLSLDFFDRRRLGDILSRLSGDIGAIERLMLSGLADGLSYILSIVVFTVALFLIDPLLAVASLACAPFIWAAGRHFSREIKQSSREARRHSGAVGAIAEESLANISLVQAYGREGAEAERFDRANRDAFDAQMASTRLGAIFAPLVELLQGIGGVAIIALGTFALSRGELTVGALLAFLALLAQLYAPIRRLGRLVNTLHSASAGAERVIELLDAEPSIREPSHPASLGTVRGDVEFDAVSFAYPGSERLALDAVSLSVGRGQTLAVVGASGAGKSTISKLLLRFYDPRAGSVRLDGHDLRGLALEDLRRTVTLLLQETLVIHGTIRENIAYGDRTASDAEVESAARAADAHAFIVAMPDGYDTIVGQRGRTLSGGQRQRLAIARAMLRSTPVLILDEPTTSLDAAARERVLAPLRRLMADRTTIVISHDLATTADADAIVVLGHGKVIETGRHEELLTRDGAYAALWRTHRTVAPREAREPVAA